MFILLFGNLLVVSSSFIFAKRLSEDKSQIDFLLSWFLLFFAQIIIVELILGLLNLLYLPYVILIHSIILLLVFCFLFKRGFLSFKRFDISFVLNNKILLLGISVFFSFFCIKTFLNLINPPICADSLQHHLAFSAIWIKNGNLANLFSLFGSFRGGAELSCITYYPINAQLFFTWLMLPLRNAFLADIGEAPFYIIGILAVYSILRKYSVNRDTAFFSGLLWALIPNLFKQIKYGSQIDVICAVLFLLVFNSLLLLKSNFNFKNALIFGINLGIFIGTKILNIIWAGALLPIFIYYFIESNKAISSKKNQLFFSTIIFSVFIFGGYMYVKNFIHTGNPFFPIQIKILGNLLFPGVMDNATYSRIYLGSYAHGVYDLLFAEGLGVQFITFILPGTFIPLILHKLIRGKAKPDIEHILFFAIPITMLLIYCFFIHARWTRYIFPYLGIGLIVSIVFLDKFSWGKKYITIFGFISVIASALELAHRSELVLSIIFSAILFIFFLVAKGKILRFYSEIFSLKILVIALIFIAIMLYFLNDNYNEKEFLRYPSTFSKKESWQRDIPFGWRWLNENTGEGKRVAYVGRTEIYPLFGAKLKNAVLYVPVNKRSMLPYDLTDGFYRREKNFKDWLANLEKLKIDFLFIALPQEINSESDNPKDFPVEDQWALLHPELFNPVFKNSLVHIYKILE